MVRRYSWLSLVGVLCCVGVATAQTTINFEAAEGYGPGGIGGQPSTEPDPNFQFQYSITSATGGIDIVNTDNGPSAAGSQCVELTADTAGQWRAAKNIGEMVNQAGGDKLVEFAFDFKWVDPNSSAGLDTRIRLVETATAFQGGAFFINDNAGSAQLNYWGFQDPAIGEGGSGGYVGNYVGDNLLEPTVASQWNRITWGYYHGQGTGAAYGQLLYIDYQTWDGGAWGPTTRVNVFNAYAGAYTTLNYFQLRMLGRDPAGTVRVDNLEITVSDPAGLPTADAGPDQTGVPATYEEGALVDLDGTGSTDDGSIVYYNWTSTVVPPGPIATGPTPMDVSVPAGQTTNLRLTVADDDGYQTFDEVAITADDPPSIPIDNLAGPYATRRGDIYGTAQHPTVVPSVDLEFELVHEVIGYVFGATADALPDRQLAFDALGNSYRVAWYDRMISIDPNVNLRWESVETGQGALANSVPVCVGDRHVYCVGGGDKDADGNELPGAAPRVWAFNKINGATVWTVELDNGTFVEPDAPNDQFRALAQLLNNKLYVVGFPYDTNADTFNDTALLWRIDCGSDTPGPVVGSIDYAVEIPWGSETARYGNLVVIPTPGSLENEVTLIWAGRSAAPDDGLNDIVVAKVDDLGLVSATGVDGALADLSAVVYSGVTGKAYVRTQADAWGNYGAWAVDPTAVSDPNATFGIEAFANANPKFNEEAWGLGFDGESVHSAGQDGVVGTYKNGEYSHALYNYDGNSGPHAIMVQNDDGDDIMITIFQHTNLAGGDPNDPNYDTSLRLVALNLTDDVDNAADDSVLDDGPVLIDNITVKVNSGTVLTEDFEGFIATDPNDPNTFFFAQVDPNEWVFVGTAGTENTAQIVDTFGPRGKVLRLDPYGGSGDQTAVIRNLPAAYGPQFQDVIDVAWYQYREDYTDNLYVGEHTYPAAASFQGDGSEPTFYPKGSIVGFATDPWGVAGTFAPLLDPNDPSFPDWQEVRLQVDYFTPRPVTVETGPIGGPFVTDGPGAVIWADALLTEYDELKFEFTATSETSSGWTPTINQPEAEYLINGNPLDFSDWNACDSLAMGPDGSIYTMEWNGFDKRWRRFKLVGSGPSICPGDSNCDGFINFRDIDYFVAAQNDNVAAWEALFGGTPPCDFLNNDANSDGFVNFRDIDPFVALQNTTCP